MRHFLTCTSFRQTLQFVMIAVIIVSQGSYCKFDSCSNDCCCTFSSLLCLIYFKCILGAASSRFRYCMAEFSTLLIISSHKVPSTVYYYRYYQLLEEDNFFNEFCH